MTPTLPHILIAEREFLIALDAEYLIKSAMDCRVSLIRPEQLDQWEAGAFADVDLCLLDVPVDASRIAGKVRRLQDHAVPVVFTTVSDIHRSGVERFGSVPVIMKPYDAHVLAETVAAHLRRRPEPQA